MKILAAIVIGTFTGCVVAFKQSLLEPQDNKFLKDYIDTKIELEISKSVERIISKVDDTAKTFTAEIKELSKKVDNLDLELSKKVDNLDKEFQAWMKAFTIFAGVCSIIVAANISTFLKEIFSIK